MSQNKYFWKKFGCWLKRFEHSSIRAGFEIRAIRSWDCWSLLEEENKKSLHAEVSFSKTLAN